MYKHKNPFLIRFFDVTLSFIGIILSSPAFLLILLIGYFSTGSSLFFQKRVGKNQKAFTLVKFRTMKKGTVSVATHLAKSDSITKFGSLLRKSKLDELPQLINVLLGQMSLVGPRPGLLNQSELTLERIKFGVYTARPGITGLAQTNNIDMSTPRKLARYDKLMLDNLSLKLYFKLIFATCLGRGAGDKIIP